MGDFRTTRPQLSQWQLVLSKTPAAAASVAPQRVDSVDLLQLEGLAQLALLARLAPPPARAASLELARVVLVLLVQLQLVRIWLESKARPDIRLADSGAKCSSKDVVKSEIQTLAMMHSKPNCMA